MNGDALAARVRDILRDVTTPTEQGQFWQDPEIRLALNVSQDSVVHYFLQSDIVAPLSGLLRTQVYAPPSFNVVNNNTGYQPLPTNYLHYASAVVWDTADEMQVYRYTPKMYLGADAEVYRNAVHIGVSINGGGIKAVCMNNPNSGFELYYYCYPSYIGLTSLNDASRPDFNVIDFTNDFYDLIARHAAILLGMKETQTQRDFKKRREELMTISLRPPKLTHLVNDLDVSINRNNQ